MYAYIPHNDNKPIKDFGRNVVLMLLDKYKSMMYFYIDR